MIILYRAWFQDEARAFAAKKGFDCSNLEEIAIQIAQLEKKNKKKKRYVVITQVIWIWNTLRSSWERAKWEKIDFF